MTVREFHGRWRADPLFTAGWKDSTRLHYTDRTKAFVARYGDLRLDQVDDVVAEWLTGGTQNTTVAPLRKMFNDAMSPKAGRLLQSNPFARAGISKGPGNRHRQPPSSEQLQRLIELAHELTTPAFAAYLEFGCWTAARPGELDALRWDRIDLERGEVELVEQWSAKAHKFDSPKYGTRRIALVAAARRVLTGMKRDNDSEFVFTNTRRGHFTASSRTHHWNRVRCAGGLPNLTLYLATRHYFGWYALNALELEPHVIAAQLGHKDGGRLVVQLYGHPEDARSRQVIRDAFDRDRHGVDTPRGRARP